MDEITLDAEGNSVVSLSVMLEMFSGDEEQLSGALLYVGDGTGNNGDPPKTFRLD